jgi:hypothetical protein
MIYLDTSVALAHLFSKDRVPPASIWNNTLVSSRLLEYELWCRVHARGLAKTHAEPVRELLSRVGFIELFRPTLERALEAFPVPVRTLDAIHLSSLEFMRAQGQSIQLASYDQRQLAAAKKLKIEALPL